MSTLQERLEDIILHLAQRPVQLRGLPEPMASSIDEQAVQILARRQKVGIESQLIFQGYTVNRGIVRLLLQPEGYELWFHGELVWKEPK